MPLISDQYQRVLFLSENISGGDNTDDVLSGIECHASFLKKINYSQLYREVGKGRFEDYIVSDIINFDLGLVIINMGDALIIDILLMKRISIDTNAKIILLLPDSEHNFEDFDRYYAQASDLVWVLSPAPLPFFYLYGIKALWTHPFDANVYYKLQSDKDIDASFIGGMYRSNRREYVDYLLSNDVDFFVAGFGSERGRVDTREKKEIISRSKINLNFTGVENKKRKIFDRLKQPKGRAMEVAMLGGFVLSEYSYGIDQIFDVGSEIDVFHSKEEMLYKINYYLKNEGVREKMAAKAYQRALSRYESCSSYGYVLKKMVSDSLTSKTYYIDKSFSEEFVSARVYHASIFFLSMNFKAFYQEIFSAFKYSGFRLKNLYFDVPRGVFHFFFR